MTMKLTNPQPSGDKPVVKEVVKEVVREVEKVVYQTRIKKVEVPVYRESIAPKKGNGHLHAVIFIQSFIILCGIALSLA